MTTKKTLLAIVVLLIIGGAYYYIHNKLQTLGPGTIPMPTDQVPADWQTYRNDEYGFEFEYPKEWFLLEIPEISQVRVASYGLSKYSNSDGCLGVDAYAKCGGTLIILQLYKDNTNSNFGEPYYAAEMHKWRLDTSSTFMAKWGESEKNPYVYKPIMFGDVKAFSFVDGYERGDYNVSEKNAGLRITVHQADKNTLSPYVAQIISSIRFTK